MTTGQRESTTYEYRLPSLGADMDEARIIEWKVAIGDTVHRGDVLASVETEKSDIDIEIWSDGVVEAFLVDIDERVPVGAPVMRLRALGAGIDGVPEPASAVGPERVATRSESPVLRHPHGPVTAANRVPASPLARRTAAELGVDLATIEGSGPNGAVVLLDVRRAADVTAATSSRPGPADAISTDGEASTIDPMRALIAERMATSNREIPHYHLRRDVDLSALIAWLEAHNLDRPIAERLLPAAAYIRAVALAAARHPELNGWWIDGRFQPGTSVNVAMAVSLRRGGLVTPKIADADRRTVDDIMVALREIVAASRTGSLRGSWMTGATITVTNLGDNGADAVHGVISPPEVGLVGFGRVAERPWVVDGAVVPRPIVTVTLAADHRATDGAIGSRFLATIATLLERPEEL